MTQPADTDTGLQCFLREVALKVRPPMHLLWDQMVKGQWNSPMTAGATLGRWPNQLEAAGSAASIAARSSSLSGSAPLEKWPTMSPVDDTTYLLKFQRG